MAQSLFDNYGYYTEDASELAKETHDAIKEVFDKYVLEDYSHRDIANIMRKAVEEMEMDYTLGHI
jgi:orotidine-5'-phosphate decarboxylase